MSWFDEFKCQHEYEYTGKSIDYEDFFFNELHFEFYRCKKCLKEKEIKVYH